MPYTNLSHKELIKLAFSTLIEAETVEENIIAHFFSPDYIQHVNGHTIDYQEFVQHIFAQKKVIQRMKVTFLSIVSEGNTVFSNHIVDAYAKDGNKVTTKVMAQFTICKGKIIAVDELTHMISGEKWGEDLGWRH